MGNSTNRISKEELRELWQGHDKNGSGDLDFAEVKLLAEEIRVREGVPEKLPDEKVEKLLNSLDTDGDKKINFKEFEGLYALLQQQRKQRAQAKNKPRPTATKPRPTPGGSPRPGPTKGAPGAAVKRPSKTVDEQQRRSTDGLQPISDLRSWAAQLRDPEWLEQQEKKKNANPVEDGGPDQVEIDSQDGGDSISGEIARDWDPSVRDHRYLYARDAAVRFSVTWTPLQWNFEAWEDFLERSGAIYQKGQPKPRARTPRGEHVLLPKRGVTEKRAACMGRSPLDNNANSRTPDFSAVRPALDPRQMVCPRVDKLSELDAKSLQQEQSASSEFVANSVDMMRRQAVREALLEARRDAPRTPRIVNEEDLRMASSEPGAAASQTGHDSELMHPGRTWY